MWIKKLILAAKRAGVNAVKFQIFKAETLADTNLKVKKFFYSKNKKETLYEMWKRLELDNKKLNLINILCKKIKIDLIFSVFDNQSIGSNINWNVTAITDYAVNFSF